MTSVNPYSPPKASLDPMRRTQQVMAERGTRLGAVIIDNLAYLVAAAPLLIAMAVTDQSFRSSRFPGPAIVGALLASIALTIGIFVIQLALLHQNGWTIGKRMLGVRIVRLDGSPASLGRVFLLRMLLPGLLGAVPFAGAVFCLIDILFIFRDDRRCIHDLIADTVVVRA